MEAHVSLLHIISRKSMFKQEGLDRSCDLFAETRSLQHVIVVLEARSKLPSCIPGWGSALATHAEAELFSQEARAQLN